MNHKTRFAPSPTGLIHIGNARTALFNALSAYKGVFLLRIENTDLERSKDTYIQQLKLDLKSLGLLWQQEEKQSDRFDIYAKYYQQLEQQDLAYPCFCTPEELALSRKLQRASGKAPRYAGTCTHLSEAETAAKLDKGLKPTLRFRVPRGQNVEFNDLVRGTQQFASYDLGDFIIRRADGTPAFFFCNAVDDALMEVSHVFRGEDHLTNTPRQILILQALNLPIPEYGHISLILGNDGLPLSKRNGSQNIQGMINDGWLATALVNYLARLGHTYTDDNLLSLEQLAEQFSIERLGRAPARFDEQQLRHWQQSAIIKASTEELWQWMGEQVHQLVPETARDEFINAIRPNITFPKQAVEWANTLFIDEIVRQPEAQTVIDNTEKKFFNHAITALEASQGDYKELIKQLKQTSGAKGKKLFMPLRAALTGATHGPELASLLSLMGTELAKMRLRF
ncbi:glutamate--tRNA ligase [Candidatus Marithrix sp. Canyon 246]|uniref:glutamate--tRNA ligase n=1 Tax=Candidatus Marithrix sp. Canyon 246 TaxID=1827136 RepID=UPI000849F21F|nr:glutamate--tRNA ligase [Candidatus Marithrix sp. Canyon 246]